MNKAKEIYALDRILDLIEEDSFGYLATQNRQFDSTIQRLYRDVSHEIDRLQRY